MPPIDASLRVCLECFLLAFETIVGFCLVHSNFSIMGPNGFDSYCFYYEIIGLGIFIPFSYDSLNDIPLPLHHDDTLGAKFFFS